MYPLWQMLGRPGICIVYLTGTLPDKGGTMTDTLTPADISHYYQRLAKLSTLPFWQLPEITEPAGPERGHVRHWTDVSPGLARSRATLDSPAPAPHRAAL